MVPSLEKKMQREQAGPLLAKLILRTASLGKGKVICVMHANYMYPHTCQGRIGALPLVVQLRSVRPARSRGIFFYYAFKGVRNRSHGSLRVSNGGALGKSCMQK